MKIDRLTQRGSLWLLLLLICITSLFPLLHQISRVINPLDIVKQEINDVVVDHIGLGQSGWPNHNIATCVIVRNTTRDRSTDPKQVHRDPANTSNKNENLAGTQQRTTLQTDKPTNISNGRTPRPWIAAKSCSRAQLGTSNDHNWELQPNQIEEIRVTTRKKIASVQEATQRSRKKSTQQRTTLQTDKLASSNKKRTPRPWIAEKSCSQTQLGTSNEIEAQSN